MSRRVGVDIGGTFTDFALHDADTVYAAFDVHKDGDFRPYLMRSTDRGRSWTSIVGDMPARRVARAIKEDPRNPDVLYVAAELGFWVSIDGGEHWVELKNNMPTLPFNDFVIHQRDNDLVLGCHGRGAWILDKINAIQELTPEVMAMPGYLFSMETAEQVRRRRLARLEDEGAAVRDRDQRQLLAHLLLAVVRLAVGGHVGHLADEARAAALVNHLSFEQCRKLFFEIRDQSVNAAIAMVRELAMHKN